MRPVLFCLLLFSVLFLSFRAWTAAGADYAGSETCLNCHADRAKLMSRSPHWKKAVPGAPINQEGCESCHGPGASHAEAGGGKGVGGLTTFSKKERADLRAAPCLNCHEHSTQLVNWDSGTHKTKDVACNDCHTLHGPPKTPAGYGTTLAGLGYSPTWEYQVCGKCHLDVKARLSRRSHHPIIEGRITCSSCHQPHGSTYPSMIKAPSVNQLCYRCHAEKRGPFMWQHPPVDENCATCHSPHGSVHQWLLVEKIPNLCQGCHDSSTHPGTLYGRSSLFTGAAPAIQSVGRACLNCHSNIHGSNAPANPANLFNSGSNFLR